MKIRTLVRALFVGCLFAALVCLGVFALVLSFVDDRTVAIEDVLIAAPAAGGIFGILAAIVSSRG